jgi:DNA-binding response OmpR family regulator
MNTDFRIGLICDDSYHLGLLKGYCHAHHYKIFNTVADAKVLDTMIQMQPNLIIIALGMEQDQAKKIDFELIREIGINHQIPICYIGDVNKDSGLEKDLTGRVDAVLASPLDAGKLDDYLYKRFRHHRHFIQEKRSRARRAADDRRVLMLEQKNTGTYKKKSASDTAKNENADYFIVEPFHTDQRSKCVLLNGKPLNLTRKEFDLFELLAKDVDRIFMSDEIIKHVWPDNNRVTRADLYQYMHLLRKKIETDPNNPQWILTVKGFGYKLDVTGAAEVGAVKLK